MKFIHHGAALSAAAILGIFSAGCSTYMAPRYSISPDVDLALKSAGKTGVGLGDFTSPTDLDCMCRAAGPLGVPDGLTHVAYIKRALEDELKLAGMYSAQSPRVTLTGVVTKLAFSSTSGLTHGWWDIELQLKSSNGKSLTTSEHYEFQSGFDALTACKQTAEAYMPAVQDLMLKTVSAPEFKTLLE
jgi:hypothetical protein